MSTAATLPALVQSFFMDRLMQQRQASPHTIASYRDTFRLLLQSRSAAAGQVPDEPDGAGSRYPAAWRHSSSIWSATARTAPAVATCAWRRSIPSFATWRCMRRSTAPSRSVCWRCPANATRGVRCLSEGAVEVDALLAAPDLATWSGRRDRALLMLAVQTGLRAAELTGLRCEDVVLGYGRPCPLRRGGAQATLHAAAQRHGPCFARLAARATRSAFGPALPDHARNGPEPRRAAGPARQASRCSASTMPLIGTQASNTTCVETYPCDGTASRRRRPDCDRSLARTRIT